MSIILYAYYYFYDTISNLFACVYKALIADNRCLSNI